MKSSRLGERVLFALFMAMAAAMLAAGYLIDQIPETLFNATLV